MYQSSELLKQAIAGDTRQIFGYIILDKRQYTFIKCDLTDTIFNEEKKSFIGSFIGKSGTIKLDHFDSLDLENKEFELYFGIRLEDGTDEYIKIGVFMVYEKTSQTEFKFADSRTKFNVLFDESKLSFPCTVKDYLLLACADSKVTLDTETFINSDLEIKKPLGFYELKCGDVVSGIAQSAGSFAKINASGHLEIRQLEIVDFSISTDMQSSWPITKLAYGPLNLLSILSEELPTNEGTGGEEPADDVEVKKSYLRTHRELPNLTEDEIKELSIVGNPFLAVSPETAIEPLWEKYKNFSYVPYSVKTQGLFNLEAGDICKLMLRNGTFIDCVIMTNILAYSGGMSGTMEAYSLDKEQEGYATVNDAVKAAQNVKKLIIDVNRNKSRIDLIGSSAENNENLLSRLSLTMEGIFQTIEKKSGETDAKMSGLETALDKITGLVQSVQKSLIGTTNVLKSMNLLEAVSKPSDVSIVSYENGVMKLGYASKGSFEFYKRDNFIEEYDESKTYSLSITISCDNEAEHTVNVFIGDREESYIASHKEQNFTIDGIRFNDFKRLSIASDDVFYLLISKLRLVEGDKYIDIAEGIKSLSTNVEQNDSTIQFVTRQLEGMAKDLKNEKDVTRIFKKFIRLNEDPNDASITLCTSSREDGQPDGFTAKLTSHGLSVYQNYTDETPIAYFKHNEFYIERGVVVSSMRIGKYEWRPLKNRNGDDLLVLKYVGGAD
ncbi:MAG: hypothetical protein ACTTIR_06155 [Eggerthia catenaformis]|uniref:hypothetical protein n=1 Tax=Eggerthia catenaformis TaxID=31973 RepID=UPI003FA14B4C